MPPTLRPRLALASLGSLCVLAAACGGASGPTLGDGATAGADPVETVAAAPAPAQPAPQASAEAASQADAETSASAVVEPAPPRKAKGKGKKLPAAKQIPVVVASVPEGDTVELQDGRVVRLAQIDAPDARATECYGVRARQALRALLPKGTRVRLESDPALDPVDAEGRLVRYVRVQGENVNLLLVRSGAATVWFARGDRGRYADDLLGEAKAARAARIGLWRECPRTKLDPKRPAMTTPPTGNRS